MALVSRKTRKATAAERAAYNEFVDPIYTEMNKLAPGGVIAKETSDQWHALSKRIENYRKENNLYIGEHGSGLRKIVGVS